MKCYYLRKKINFLFSMTPVQHAADSGKLALLDWLWTRQKTSTENQVSILSELLL